MKDVWTSIKKVFYTKHSLYSVLIALALIICGYFSNNWALFTGEELNLYTSFESFKRIFNNSDDNYSGALFINTSFDKELIPVTDIGHEVGFTEITDRKKLLDFLKLLSQTDYGYTVIDLRFVEGLSHRDSIGAKTDAELFDFILNMDRCVVATHDNMKLLGGLETKAGLAGYKTTVTATNFTRYQYFDSIPSIPLHVYNELNKKAGKDTVNYSSRFLGLPIYKEGRKLCQNSVFCEFSSKGLQHMKNISAESGSSFHVQEFDYKNLGSDYCNHIGKLPDSMVVKMIEGDLKDAGDGTPGNTVVYIGNVVEDLHDTYAGLQPGAVILNNALKSLQDGRHIVRFIRILLLFLLYYFIALFVLQDISLCNLLPSRFISKHQFVCYLIQLASISTVLLIFDIIDIKVFHVTTNFFFAVTLFGFLKLYVRFKKNQV